MRTGRLKLASILICLAAVLIYGGYEMIDRFFTDQTVPVIKIEEEVLSVSIKDGKKSLLKGVTAHDEKDGDVTDSLVIESISRFIGEKRIVTYAAFDKDNHVGKAERVITYTDYEPPKFSSKNGFRIPLKTDKGPEGLCATDCIDGDITKQIKNTPGGYVDTNTDGEYQFQFQVANKAGDVEYLPVTIEVYDPAENHLTPQIYLSEYIVYVKKGEKINPKAYLEKVVIGSGEYEVVNGTSSYSASRPTLGGTIGRHEISMDDSDVNYKKAGTYEAVFSLRVNGEYTGKNRLVIVVR